VAQFVGMKNIYDARCEGRSATVGKLTLRLAEAAGRRQAHLAVRPEDVHLDASDSDSNGPNRFQGRVCRIRHQGFFSEVSIEVEGVELKSILPDSSLYRLGLAPGRIAVCAIDPADLHVI